MAEYRKVHTKIWDDDWFYTLDAEGKVLWFYLITNRNASVAGIYECSLRVMAYEAGIPPARAEELLAAFQQAGKIEREGDVIWVKRLRHYQESASPKVQTGIRNDVNGIEDCSVKCHYLAHYNIPSDTVSDSIEPSDTAPHGDRDYTETETMASGKPLEQRPAPKAASTADKPPRPDQEMFAALVEVCHLKSDRLTDKTRAQLNVTGKKLRQAGLSPPDVRAFAAWYEDQWHKARAPMNL